MPWEDMIRYQLFLCASGCVELQVKTLQNGSLQDLCGSASFKKVWCAPVFWFGRSSHVCYNQAELPSVCCSYCRSNFPKLGWIGFIVTRQVGGMTKAIFHHISTIVLSNCACSRMFTSWKKWRNNAKQMELENTMNKWKATKKQKKGNKKAKKSKEMGPR